MDELRGSSVGDRQIETRAQRPPLTVSELKELVFAARLDTNWDSCTVLLSPEDYIWTYVEALRDGDLYMATKHGDVWLDANGYVESDPTVPVGQVRIKRGFA